MMYVIEVIVAYLEMIMMYIIEVIVAYLELIMGYIIEVLVSYLELIMMYTQSLQLYTHDQFKLATITSIIYIMISSR